MDKQRKGEVATLWPKRVIEPLPYFTEQGQNKNLTSLRNQRQTTYRLPFLFLEYSISVLSLDFGILSNNFSSLK